MAEPDWLDSVKHSVEQALSTDENELPFGYYSPESEGRVSWVCARDPQDRITAVFIFNGEGGQSDRRSTFLPSFEEAVKMRDQLVASGWKRLTPPKVSFKYDDGTERELNRKQKRFLKQKLEQMSKSNPFEK